MLNDYGFKAVEVKELELCDKMYEVSKFFMNEFANDFFALINDYDNLINDYDNYAVPSLKYLYSEFLSDMLICESFTDTDTYAYRKLQFSFYNKLCGLADNLYLSIANSSLLNFSYKAHNDYLNELRTTLEFVLKLKKALSKYGLLIFNMVYDTNI